MGTSRVCTKCGGTGYLPKYDHVEGGICFRCNGSGDMNLRKGREMFIKTKSELIRSSLQFPKKEEKPLKGEIRVLSEEEEKKKELRAKKIAEIYERVMADYAEDPEEKPLNESLPLGKWFKWYIHEPSCDEVEHISTTDSYNNVSQAMASIIRGNSGRYFVKVDCNRARKTSVFGSRKLALKWAEEELMSIKNGTAESYRDGGRNQYIVSRKYLQVKQMQNNTRSEYYDREDE